ncbi:MAG: hypothetical protein ACJ72I_18615 [Pseudonocardiaceae bacterium]
MSLYPYAATALAALVAAIFQPQSRGRHASRSSRSLLERMWRLFLLWLLLVGIVMALLTSEAGHDNLIAAMIVLSALVAGGGTAVWPMLIREITAVIGRRQATMVALGLLASVLLIAGLAPTASH